MAALAQLDFDLSVSSGQRWGDFHSRDLSSDSGIKPTAMIMPFIVLEDTEDLSEQ